MTNYVLVLQIGTFCDHYLMNYVVSEIRKVYKLVFISNKKVCIDINDVNIYHDTPISILNQGSEVVTGFITEPVLFSIKNPSLVATILNDTSKFNDLVLDTIRKYRPIKIIAHCANLKDLILLDRFDIPTYMVYFAPGFIPNFNIPFIFNNSLKTKHVRIYQSSNKIINCESGLDYYRSIIKLCSLFGKKIILSKMILNIKKIKHLLFYQLPLIPKTKYFTNLSTINLSLIKYHIDRTKLSLKLRNWIKNKTNLIFVSFGSYTNEIISRLNYLIPKLDEFCCRYNYFAIIQIKNNSFYNLKRLYFYSKYINYYKILPKCKLVIFSGSIGIQSLCWYFKTRMLFVPYIPEQFFWAKLYQYHTGVQYLDYQKDEVPGIINKILKSLTISIEFHNLVKKSFINDISIKVMDYIIHN